MSEPPAFDPHRFQAAAAHYRRGRTPYPPLLIRRVAEAAGLGATDRALDLGCGPGQLAIGFGYFAGAVIGLDPEPEMLAAARQAAEGLVPNVAFRLGSSYDLAPELGRFRLVTMGRSFHWMDRAATLRRLDAMIEPGGAVALFGDSHLDVPENAWHAEWREVTDRYAAAGDAERQARRAAGRHAHDAALLASAFCRLERLSVIERHSVAAESLVARAHSMSSVSRGLGAGQAARLEQELGDLLARLAPGGTVSEVVESTALVARRP